MSEAKIAATKRERLRELIRHRSFRNDRTFLLASDRVSDVFFDLKPTMVDPEGIDLLADLLLDRLAGLGVAHVGGLAMGAIPLVVGVVLRSRERGIPLQGFWVRKERKDHGATTLIDGRVPPGARVAILEDVVTTGDSAMKAVADLRRNGCEVAAVIAVVDRIEGARERLADEGLELIALFDKSDFTSAPKPGPSAA